MKKKENQLPDGIYFIAGTSDSEINTKTYVKYEPGMTEAPIPAKYIGVKLGHRAIAVALEDLPGDENGELQLLPSILDYSENTEQYPKADIRYSWDEEAKEYNFNPLEDFEGKANTVWLKKYGCTIDIPNGEWVPSVGELRLLSRFIYHVNRAVMLAGGQPINKQYVTSTKSSQHMSWLYNFPGELFLGLTCTGNFHAVRTVTEF